MKTTILYIPADPTNPDPEYHMDVVVGVRPQKWDDEEWAALVQRNRDYYGADADLKEKEWDYGK